MSKDLHVQCELRTVDGGVVVTWLPVQHKGAYIKVGHFLTLDDEEGIFCVAQMFGIRPSVEVKAHERDWKSQRKASDI